MYWLLEAVAFMVARLSWRRAQSLGAMLGLVWFHALRIRRRMVLDNLAIALPDRAGEHLAIAREVYRGVGIGALELLRMRSTRPEDLASVVRVHGRERYEAALLRGRGVIVVTAHTGNYDLLACAHAASGVPLAIVSRNLRSRGSNRFWMETRAAFGLRIFEERTAARACLGWLGAGKVLGLVVDQRVGPSRGGVLAPFFGEEAWTSPMAARLADRTGAALLPVRIVRAADGTHDVYIESELPPLRSMGGASREERIARAVAAVNEVVERWITERPGQWLWLHRRFLRPDRYRRSHLESR